jgi:hypothetical protein
MSAPVVDEVIGFSDVVLVFVAADRRRRGVPGAGPRGL